MFVVPFYILGFGSILAAIGLIWEILEDCATIFKVHPSFYIPEHKTPQISIDPNLQSRFSIM